MGIYLDFWSRSCSACARASCARCCLVWRSEFIHLHGTPSLCPRFRGLALPAVWEFNNNSDLCALALVLCMRSCFLRPLLLGLALRVHTLNYYICMALPACARAIGGSRSPRFGSLIIIAIFARSRSCSACARASCARCCLVWRSELIQMHGTPACAFAFGGSRSPRFESWRSQRFCA